MFWIPNNESGCTCILYKCTRTSKFITIGVRVQGGMGSINSRLSRLPQLSGYDFVVNFATYIWREYTRYMVINSNHFCLKFPSDNFSSSYIGCLLLAADKTLDWDAPGRREHSRSAARLCGHELHPLPGPHHRALAPLGPLRRPLVLRSVSRRRYRHHSSWRSHEMGLHREASVHWNEGCSHQNVPPGKYRLRSFTSAQLQICDVAWTDCMAIFNKIGSDKQWIGIVLVSCSPTSMWWRKRLSCTRSVRTWRKWRALVTNSHFYGSTSATARPVLGARWPASWSLGSASLAAWWRFIFILWR